MIECPICGSAIEEDDQAWEAVMTAQFEELSREEAKGFSQTWIGLMGMITLGLIVALSWALCIALIIGLIRWIGGG